MKYWILPLHIPEWENDDITMTEQWQENAQRMTELWQKIVRILKKIQYKNNDDGDDDDDDDVMALWQFCLSFVSP